MRPIAHYIKLLKGLEHTLRTDFDVRNLTVFGSYARGEQTPDSDLDLLVETSTPNPFVLMDLKEFIKGVTGLDVDIVRKHSNVNHYLSQEIEKDGIRVI